MAHPAAGVFGQRDSCALTLARAGGASKLLREFDDLGATGGADRMTQCDGAAVDVDALRIEVEFPDAGQGLGGKRLSGWEPGFPPGLGPLPEWFETK